MSLDLGFEVREQNTGYLLSLSALLLPLLTLTSQPPPALMLRRARGGTGQSMPRKGMLTEDRGCESILSVVNILICITRAYTLNHEVGLEMNLALRSRVRAYWCAPAQKHTQHFSTSPCVSK